MSHLLILRTNLYDLNMAESNDADVPPIIHKNNLVLETGAEQMVSK